MNNMTEKAALSRLTCICAKGEYSKADAFEKLRKWGFDTKTSERIVVTLESGGFIDEERFCRAYIHDKLRLAKWGRLKIAQALSLKRIPSDIARKCLDELIDEDEYIKRLRELLKVKRRSVTGKSEIDIKVKLIRFAASRGYEMKYITSVLGDVDEYENP